MFCCFNHNEENLKKRSQSPPTIYFQFQEDNETRKDVVPYQNGKFIQIIYHYYRKNFGYGNIFGFLNDHTIYIVKSIMEDYFLTILDLDSKNVLCKKKLDKRILLICPLPETPTSILLFFPRGIMLFDYKQNKLTQKSFPKDIVILSCDKIDDDSFLMTDKEETIYVYTLSSHSFSYFKYNTEDEQTNKYIYIINKEIIVIWKYNKYVETINIKTKKLLSNRYFNNIDKFAFVDSKNGKIYSENGIANIDKTNFKILILNYNFFKGELFDYYPYFDIFKEIVETLNMCYTFSIPNSTCFCNSNSFGVQLYDYNLKESIGYSDGLIYPYIIETSPKYILTQFGVYKINRNRL